MILKGRNLVGLNPVIQEFENAYTRWWLNGLLWGTLCGVGLSSVVIAVSGWLGWLSVRWF
jgi:hypothetical protein